MTPAERERAEFKKLPKREPHIILPNYFCPTCGAGSDTPIVLDSEEAEAARREERERCAARVGQSLTKLNNYAVAHDNVIDASWVVKVIEEIREALDEETA